MEVTNGGLTMVLGNKSSTHEKFFRYSIDPMVIVDEEGQFVQFNQAFAELSCRTKKELFELSLIKILHRKDIDSYNHAIAALKKSKNHDVHFKARIYCNNGEPARWLDWRAYFDADEGAIYAVARDVTDSKLAGDILAHSKELYSRIADLAFDWNYIAKVADDNKLQFTWVSDSFEKETGFTFDGINHSGWLAVVHPDDRTIVSERSWRLFSGDGDVIEYRFCDGDGEWRWIRDHSIPSRSKDSGEEIIYGSVRDITDIKRRHDELQNAVTEAKAATKLKDKFVSMVAHDLKAPLSAMTGLLKILQKDTSDVVKPRGRELFSHVIKSGENMITMITELLSISRLQSGEINVTPMFLKVSTLVDEVVKSLKHLADEKGIILKNETPINDWVNADPAIFMQVINNLVSNAIKFSERKDSITISFKTEPSPTLIVSDTGIGMSEELMEGLFLTDVKSSRMGTGGEIGTGLGLSYSRDIMRAHGGDLSAESEEGKGAFFYATFPRATPKVALIGFSREDALALAEHIMPHDIAVLSFEELDKNQRGKINLIIVDGLHASKELFSILSDEKNKNPPIIYIAENGSASSLDEAAAINAKKLVLRPIDWKVLEENIFDCLV